MAVSSASKANLIPEPNLAEIDACRRGDRRALEAVFSRESPMLERQIARLVGPGADVEDLLQVTLVEAIGAFPRYRGEASVRTWLARIAVHVVHRHLRSPERRRQTSLELLANVADRAPVADEIADSRRKVERVYHHLDAIGPMKRIAFILHVLEGRSIAEVAALVGASKMATKSRVFWARKSLLARARKDPQLVDLLLPMGALR